MTEPAAAGHVWTDARVSRWLQQADGIDRQLAPVTDVLFARSQLADGERVVDVGCGTGPTTRLAAGRVFPTGSVTGLDVAEAMIEAARVVPVEDGTVPIHWVVANAVTWSPDGDPFDVVISRFGLMFFSDPRRAFANLAAATSGGGRLCAVTWSHRDRNPLFELPMRIALATIEGRLGLPAMEPPPIDDGPFSLSDPAHVINLLTSAGWKSAACEAVPLRIEVGGGVSPADAAASSIDLGPTRIVCEPLDDTARHVVLDAIAAGWADHVVDGHVVADAEINVVTAIR